MCPAAVLGGRTRAGAEVPACPCAPGTASFGRALLGQWPRHGGTPLAAGGPTRRGARSAGATLRLPAIRRVNLIQLVHQALPGPTTRASSRCRRRGSGREGRPRASGPRRAAGSPPPGAPARTADAAKPGHPAPCRRSRAEAAGSQRAPARPVGPDRGVQLIRGATSEHGAVTAQAPCLPPADWRRSRHHRSRRRKRPPRLGAAPPEAAPGVDGVTWQDYGQDLVGEGLAAHQGRQPMASGSGAFSMWTRTAHFSRRYGAARSGIGG